MSQERAARGAAHRIPALVLVGVLIAGLVVLERSSSSTAPSISHRVSAVDGPSVPATDAVSVAWYCAEGTSVDGGRADETVLIANLAQHPIDATITVMRGANHSFGVE